MCWFAHSVGTFIYSNDQTNDGLAVTHRQQQQQQQQQGEEQQQQQQEQLPLVRQRLFCVNDVVVVIAPSPPSPLLPLPLALLMMCVFTFLFKWQLSEDDMWAEGERGCSYINLHARNADERRQEEGGGGGVEESEQRHAQWESP